MIPSGPHNNACSERVSKHFQKYTMCWFEKILRQIILKLPWKNPCDHQRWHCQKPLTSNVYLLRAFLSCLRGRLICATFYKLTMSKNRCSSIDFFGYPWIGCRVCMANLWIITGWNYQRMAMDIHDYPWAVQSQRTFMNYLALPTP